MSTAAWPLSTKFVDTGSVLRALALRGGELLGLGRPLQRRRARPAADHRLEHLVEVPGADLALMAGRRVAVLLHLELSRLEPHVGRHALGEIVARELEGPEVLEMPPRQRD